MEIKVVGVATGTFNYEEMGFGDGRGGKPRAAWEALCELSGAAGEPVRLDKERAQEIRELLKEHFSLNTDPLFFKTGLGYIALFKTSRSLSFDS